MYDSVHPSEINFRFQLEPSVNELSEITVSNKVYFTNNENIPTLNTGDIKLNHYVANFLPGQGDNAVFNLLRLMPGIQVAGEQASDLLIWGSQEGQSRVFFDGFTLFGLKNYNDYISVVNPFMVKKIEIKKGGFDAHYGNRVGGLIHISGLNGNRNKPAFSFNINNMTLNAMVEIPVLKKSTLVAAYRQTFYDLYNSDDFNIFSPARSFVNRNDQSSNRFNSLDVSVLPERYSFRDFNLKYTYNFSNGNLAAFSYYRGGDDFKLLADASVVRDFQGKGRETSIFDIDMEDEEHNVQTGMSAFFSHQWANGAISRIEASHSDFKRQSTNKIFLKRSTNNPFQRNDSLGFVNNATENSFKLTHQTYFDNGYNIEIGSAFVFDDASIERFIRNTNISDILSRNMTYTSNRAVFYLTSYLPLNRSWLIKAGIRGYYTRETFRQLYVDPRFNIDYTPSEHITFSASWGIYHQFMYKIANIDNDNNYTWFWTTANKNLPVLNSRHRILSANYHKKGFSVDVNAFFKTTHNNIRRTVTISDDNKRGDIEISNQIGDVRSAGIDFYIKQKFRKHQAWLSYTLSRTTDSFAGINEVRPNYSLSSFHQLHEFKAAALFNFRNFHFSGNYVFGSGTQLIKEMLNTPDVSYHRVDAGVTYRLSLPHLMLETGFSVLNVFNTENIRYQNLINVNLARNLGSVKIYSGAVPFTPTLFLKIKI